jgi:formamidopyrimidine-DNA glycosylase
MVEGPQASVMAKWVKRKYKNQMLKNIKILKGRYKKRIPKNFTSFQNSLPLRLLDVIKKGKVIFLFFEKDWVVIVKFGMTAWLSDKEEDPNVIFDFGDKKLFYKDVRQFGTLTFTQDPVMVLKELNKLAPDILDDKISFQDIQDRISSNKNIDVILMDQKIVLSGIGNIVKSEVLYDAKIDPRRKGSDLTREEWKQIFNSAKKISNKVVKNIENNKDDFEGMIKIYGKETDSNGNKIQKYNAKDGRVTFWVSEVQN